VVIGVNNTVAWINKDPIAHTVTSQDYNLQFSPIFYGYLSPNGGTFTCTFVVAGTYNYFCSIHPDMQGKVIVET
jgi:plastocyanin